MINSTMAALILALSLLGILGFAGLLVVGFRMWAEERAAKSALPDKAQEVTAPPPAEITPEIQAATAGETPAPPPTSSPEAIAEPSLPKPAVSQTESGTTPLRTELEAPPAAAPEGKTPGLRLPFLSRGPAGQEILRVVREPATGQFTIHIAGRPYANFHDIQNPASEQAFMMAFRLLQAFSENAVVPAPTANEAEAAPRAAQPLQPAPVAYRAAELPPPELPSMQPLQQLRKLRGKQPPAAKFVIKSITEQIEDHLQDKIVRTPLARRGVHVRSDTQGNALFLLDGKTYSTVDDVPDPEVQQAIRETISEWEKKK